MNQAWVRSATRRPAKVVIHIDIWEAIFDQLAILEHHRTLTTLWTSSPSTESPQTTQPYINYLRHLGFLNLLSVKNFINFLHPHFMTAALQQTNHQNLNSTNDQDIIVADQITAKTPIVKRRTLLGRFAPSYLITDPATENIKNMLRFVVVYSREQNYRGEIWTGNGYEFDEERMLVQLWDDIRGSAEALQLLRGSGPYPPFLGLMENTGARIASCD
ncbi:uncharacterized protein GLRG_00395 [Colletotrichum graminicola M1.001]|uniref:Uncharacterized protein n=1 Tax=Colletotrichum graminicola (strain M1.001 / M2 / FGSC 10212) TaxID=645133 RepID=E3Q2F0_COLGM|nr:uncharacterized protein GLRG_00395 [Colletotrichum graminicola M1.001]EFQ25251.1 hypothetical protein GLRG_00395 [Colletotrichum graminicola M1.001]